MDAPPNQGQLAQELFGKISRSISAIYTNSLTEDLCGKYDISSTWELARLRRAAEQRRISDQTTNDDTTLNQVEERIRDAEIRYFIKDQFNSATSDEHQYIFEHTSKEFQAGGHYGEDDWDYCNEHCLQNFLKLGYRGLGSYVGKRFERRESKVVPGLYGPPLRACLSWQSYSASTDNYKILIKSSSSLFC